jgi:2-polyprenyl-3-methyl-5-hydroxy-6-metoxy-1,4-benzoquinol methylase
MERNVYIRQYNQNKNHWWFEGRKLILSRILKKFINKKKIIILDYGCGVGINLSMLSKYGKVFYYDKSRLAINYVKKKYYNKKFFINIDELLKYKNKFDLIVATDVIEHIKNDKKEILKISNLLKKDGYILITVPAFQSLFSSKDISLKHYRRYNKDTLHNLLNKNFHVIKFTYFNFILFIPIAILIFFFKITKIKFINSVEKKPTFLINKLAFYLFAVESFLISKMKLPFGISLLFFGKKIND